MTDRAIPGEFADRLLGVVEEQAASTARLAVLQEQNVENTTAIRESLREQTRLMMATSETLKRIEEDQRHGREQAVAFLKDRIETAAPKVNPLVGWIVAGAAAVTSAALAALAALKSIGSKPD